MRRGGGIVIKIYIRDAQNEAWVSIAHDGETDIVICRVGSARHIQITAGGKLPASQKTKSAVLLRRVGEILTDYVNAGPGRRLWFEPIDARRYNVYLRAFQKLGLNVIAQSCIIEVTSQKAAQKT
ncbi:MAG: hypothetical protein ABIG87_00880 [Patescibacteria group bacterium]